MRSPSLALAALAALAGGPGAPVLRPSSREYDPRVPRNDEGHLAKAAAKRVRKGAYWLARQPRARRAR